MKNIVITGASGYIGKKLVLSLVKENKILAITRKKLQIDLPENCLSNLEYCNLAEDNLEKKIIGFAPDVFVSTTCSYDNKPEQLGDIINANYVFPCEILRIASLSSKGKKNRFISLGTSLPASLNLYSRTKKQFSEIGKLVASSCEIEFCNILLESFYGVDEPDNRFISRTVSQLKQNLPVNLTKGLQRRDYVFIDDVIKVLTYLCLTEKVLPNEIPLGSGESPSIQEIIKYLAEKINSTSEINFGSIPSRVNEPSTWANLTVLREIGYEEKFTYWHDGMNKMIGVKK